MRITTKIYKHDKRSRVQQSSTEQQKDNSSNMEEIQSRTSPIPHKTGIIIKHGKNM